LGIAYHRLGDYRKAIEYHEQSLIIKREIGDRLGEGASLGNLGIAYYSLGDTEKACSLRREALTIFEAIESPSANVIRLWLTKNCQSSD
jgi:tetratricopeptide (TPR) repeat protein